MKLIKTIILIIFHPINKKNPLRSLVIFLKWQLISRYSKKKFIFKWVNEIRFYLQKGDHGMTGNLYCGLMEYEDMSFVTHFLRKNDNFFDIGANVGSYTLLASGVKKCKTICFEPIPKAYKKLIENINLNKIHHLVDSRNLGVGNINKKHSFTNNLNTKNQVNLDVKNKNTINVDVIKLDGNFNPSVNTLVKIDVEGYEYFVLKGGFKFFSNPKVIGLIIEQNGSGKFYGHEDSQIYEIILSYGFKPVKYDPFTRRLDYLDKYNITSNTIYIKDFDFVQKRCLSSSKICIHTPRNLLI